MLKVPQLWELSETERRPLVVYLLEVISELNETVQQLKESNQVLRDEVGRLKGQKGKPDIKASRLEPVKKEASETAKSEGKRAGSLKRKKTRHLQVHQTVDIAPEEVPQGSVFKGYQRYTVQDIKFQVHTTQYRLQRWLSPEGKMVTGKLPQGVQGCHYGPELRSYVLYQYYHGHVTQPLIYEQLCEWKILISKGQVNRIITEGHERFHEEKEAILKTGLEVSPYIQVDDTGARHEGKNGVCTQVGNESFAYFQSTDSKSRINFLQILQAGTGAYIFNEEAFVYMSEQGLPKAALALLKHCKQTVFETEAVFLQALSDSGILSARYVRIATEGALYGQVLCQALHPDLAIISDDAGQFNILTHGLCWVHAERLIAKLIGFNDDQRSELESIRDRIWDLYKGLKAYKLCPSDTQKLLLEKQFDDIVATKTCFASLNSALKRMKLNKSELLLVLERPDVPLHNNRSENHIRDVVKKRKISGSTRNDSGRQCRDTFASLKRTCRNLGISFWCFLNDRIAQTALLPPLPLLIRQHAAST